MDIDVITEPPPLPLTTNDFLLLNDVIDVEGEMRVVRLASAVFGSMCLNCCDCDILLLLPLMVFAAVTAVVVVVDVAVVVVFASSFSTLQQWRLLNEHSRRDTIT